MTTPSNTLLHVITTHARADILRQPQTFLYHSEHFCNTEFAATTALQGTRSRAGSNTYTCNITCQLAIQHCCVTSCSNLLLVFPRSTSSPARYVRGHARDAPASRCICALVTDDAFGYYFIFAQPQLLEKFDLEGAIEDLYNF